MTLYFVRYVVEARNLDTVVKQADKAKVKFKDVREVNINPKEKR